MCSGVLLPVHAMPCMYMVFDIYRVYRQILNPSPGKGDGLLIVALAAPVA